MSPLLIDTTNTVVRFPMLTCLPSLIKEQRSYEADLHLVLLVGVVRNLVISQHLYNTLFQDEWGK